MGDDSDATAVVPDVAPTERVELAWSDDTEAAERAPESGRPWPLVVLLATAVLAGAGFIVGLVAARARPPASSHEPTITMSAAPTHSAALPPPTAQGPRPLQFDAKGEAMVPPNATPEELQGVIVSRMDWAGLPHGAPGQTASDAESVCEYLMAGHRTVIELFLWVDRTRPAVGHDRVGAFSGLSVGTYCRQYDYLFDNVGSGATS